MRYSRDSANSEWRIVAVTNPQSPIRYTLFAIRYFFRMAADELIAACRLRAKSMAPCMSM
jgi:hypothetical protein